MFCKSNSKRSTELLSFFFPNSENIHAPFPSHHSGDFPDSIYLHFIQEFSNCSHLHGQESLPHRPPQDLQFMLLIFSRCYMYL